MSFAEHGPPTLYFSSNREGGLGGSNLYLSQRKILSWSFKPAEPVSNVNSTFDDARPSIRRDRRELVFDSNQPGGQGGFDIWSASRDTCDGSWSEPVNLGPNVNSAANETRPSLSWEGTTLLFGSNREGGEGISDIYYTTRDCIPDP